MTGKEECVLVEEGRNMLRVRQSSDTSLPGNYEEKFCAQTEERYVRNILFRCTGDHSYWHRMTGEDQENIWPEEEKTCQLVTQQKGCLKAIREEERCTEKERILPP